jgi:hypothetical protein
MTTNYKNRIDDIVYNMRHSFMPADVACCRLIEVCRDMARSLDKLMESHGEDSRGYLKD